MHKQGSSRNTNLVLRKELRLLTGSHNYKPKLYTKFRYFWRRKNIWLMGGTEIQHGFHNQAHYWCIKRNCHCCLNRNTPRKRNLQHRKNRSQNPYYYSRQMSNIDQIRQYNNSYKCNRSQKRVHSKLKRRQKTWNSSCTTLHTKIQSLLNSHYIDRKEY